MNDNLIIMGINAPRKHQEVIARLVYGITNLYMRAKTGLFPYPETMIDEGQTSPVPDVMIVDIDNELTKTIIEVTHTQGVKKDSQKLWELMNDYDVPEGFVYDYKRHIWYKYDLASGEIKENTSFSDIANVDLNDFLLLTPE